MFKVNALSAQEAAAAKRQEKRGWQTVTVTQAHETYAAESGNPVVALVGTVDGGEWRDWLNFSPRGAEKLRHFLAAVSREALARYEQAGEVSADTFIGVTLQARFDSQKRGGVSRSVVTDYRPVADQESGGVIRHLRAAG